MREINNKKALTPAIINNELKPIMQFIACPYEVKEKKFPYTLALKAPVIQEDFNESTILTKEDKELVALWLNKKPKLTLLYRATRDGFNATTFH